MTPHRFGSHRHTWCVHICLVIALSGAVVPHAMAADAVTDWNAFTTGLFTVQPSGFLDSRIYAIQHAAIHDALNTIEPLYQRYTRVRGLQRPAPRIGSGRGGAGLPRGAGRIVGDQRLGESATGSTRGSGDHSGHD